MNVRCSNFIADHWSICPFTYLINERYLWATALRLPCLALFYYILGLFVKNTIVYVGMWTYWRVFKRRVVLRSHFIRLLYNMCGHAQCALVYNRASLASTPRSHPAGFACVVFRLSRLPEAAVYACYLIE